MEFELRIHVLMGGVSRERGVSLATGCEVAAALRGQGHSVTLLDTARGVLDEDEERRLRGKILKRAPFASDGHALPDARVIAKDAAIRETDLAFLALHGGAGEDGTVQSLLDAEGIPYTGSSPLGCAIAMDKDLSKRLLRAAGLRTPDWLSGRRAARSASSRLGLPLIVKPTTGGSSIQVALARTESEVDAAVRRATAEDEGVMYEAYVQGREFTVGVLGDEALPVVEIEPKGELFDFRSKYEEGMAVETAPAKIPDSMAAELQQAARVAHEALRLEHYSRVDFIVDEAGDTWCLEANALPGLTANSLLPKAARAAGISFPDLCDRIAWSGRVEGRRRIWSAP